MSDKPDFAKLFAALASHSSDFDSHAPKALPEAVVAELQLRAKAFIEPVPYKLGDLVTVRKGSCIKGAGAPHIVIDVDPTAEPVFAGESGNNKYGTRNQVRVLTNIREEYATFWLEAGVLKPYALPIATVTRLYPVDDAPIL